MATRVMITLGKGCDPLRAEFLFNGADPSYVRSGFLSPKGGASGENRTPISSLEGWSNSLYTTLAFNSLLVLMGGIEFYCELIRFTNSRSPKG